MEIVTPKHSVNFTISGRVSSSATIWEREIEDSPYDFLSFLGLAQHFNVNLLPLTWQPALDIVGRGATSQICQAYLSLQTSFAFKSFASVAVPTNAGEVSTFRALISELSLLSDSIVRLHPNINPLVGVCWDAITDRSKVWPVFVFEKTQCGDLYRFMETAAGVGLTFDQRFLPRVL